MTLKLLIGIPLHSKPEHTITNLILFYENRMILKKLDIKVNIFVSCDNNFHSFINLFQKLNIKDSYYLKFDYAFKKKTSMVDNWNNALNKNTKFDYCYLLHDDDLIDEYYFFNNILKELKKALPNILSFNAILRKDNNILGLQRKPHRTELHTGKEYFNITDNSCFPAPSQTIFKMPYENKVNVYSDLQNWCPETKLYIDIMTNKDSTFLKLNYIGVTRLLHPEQVSHKTLWKGVADLMVLGGISKYSQIVKTFLKNERNNLVDMINDYFDNIFFEIDFYQKDRFNNIINFIIRNNTIRSCFLKKLSAFIISKITVSSQKEILISKIYEIIKSSNNIFFKEKVIRILELSVSQVYQKIFNRGIYDFEILKDLDNKFRNRMYSKKYILERFLSIELFCLKFPSDAK
jgi:hypothetical protein